MRILLLTETLPYPLDSGGRIKTYHTLRMLADTHEVHCHALTYDDLPPGGLPGLEPVTLTSHRLTRGARLNVGGAARAVASGLPFLVARRFDARIARAIREAFDRTTPDLVYCDHLSMATYAGYTMGPVLHDAHNVEAILLGRHVDGLRRSPLRWAGGWEWRMTERYERRVYEAASMVLATSDVDADAIRRMTGGRARVRTVPIALDVAAIRPVDSVAKTSQLLYVGGLHWPPNADAVDYFSREILPRVRQAQPAAELVVVGRDDGAAASRLRARQGVRLVGRVDDLRPFFESSRALVVPLRAGSGTRVKILEAFAHGVPVVSTAIGHEGLPVRAGVELLSAEGPSAFVEQVIAVLRDDGLAQALTRAGRAFALGRHDVGRVAAGLLAAVDEAVLG